MTVPLGLAIVAWTVTELLVLSKTALIIHSSLGRRPLLSLVVHASVHLISTQTQIPTSLLTTDTPT